MSKYALIFTGGSMKSTPEEIQQMMQDWGAWYGSIGADLVDAGSAFMPQSTVSVTSEGVEEENVTGASGYAIVQASTHEKAIEYAQSCPIVADGGSVEVHPFMEVPTA